LNNVDKDNQFIKTTRKKYFVDKTELIEKLNPLVGEADQFVCITRPRRFGKSINAAMLASYYSKSLDTKDIFDKLNVSKCDSYEEHLNKHNVIYMSFNTGEGKFTTYAEYKNFFVDGLIKDLKEICPEINENDPISKIFTDAYKKIGEGFIFIIDEWDYIFSDKSYEDTDKINFLAFLTELLKDKSYVEFAYMTGILPIAKYFSTSFCNMFPNEHNSFNDRIYGDYFGFTEKEVKKICAKQKKVTLNQLQEWYDGYYTYDNVHLYNPRSVSYALSYGYCDSYWTNTGKMDEIIDCIKNNLYNIKKDILDMMNGKKIYVDVPKFATEKMDFSSKEKIFSAMVVYGFLCYHGNMLSIPNKELKIKFIEALSYEANNCEDEFSRVMKNSEELLKATIEQDTETMSRLLRDAHSLYSSTLTYNDENSLSCVIQMAYITALKKYEMHRELKGGEGFVDFVFIPYDKNATAFIMELKVNSTPEEALKQIKSKNYAQSLRNIRGQKLAIGITYSSKNTSEDDNRQHFVKIEELQ
jgi:hypothetical protein